MLLQTLRSLKWTPASDVYSFGVLLFEILSRMKLPFAEWTNQELARKLGDPACVLWSELCRGLADPPAECTASLYVGLARSV